MSEKNSKRARSSSSIDTVPPTPSSPSPSSSPATTPNSDPAYIEARVSSSLRNFLLRDLDPEGGRIILPFFTTLDLLTLSQCSRDFLKYRLYLSEVKIVPHPLATPSVKKGLVRLLVEQQAGVQYLRVEDRSMVPVLDLVAWGCCERLKTLDLSGIELTDEDALHVGRALSGGGLRSLECLNLAGCGRSKLSVIGLGYVTEALSQGACPNIRRLKLSYHVSMGPGAGEVIAVMLNSRQCLNLEELELKNTPLRQESFVHIAHALEQGCCRELRRLSISGCYLTPPDGRALGEALLAGSCPKLEELEMFGNNNLGDEGHIPVFAALEAGCCTGLEVLHLGNADLQTVGARALGSAISSGNCGRLKSLNFYGGSTDPQGMLRILESIKNGGCPLVRHINLSLNKLEPDHGRMLGEAMFAGVCSHLEDLVLSMNETLGDDGMITVTEAMAAGHCPEIKQLRMSVVGMSSMAASSLARSFGSGFLARLQGVKLQWNRLVEDGAMAEIVKGLSAGRPRDIRSISALGTIMKDEAGQALIDAIRDNAWPKLEELAVAVEATHNRWITDFSNTLTLGTILNLRLLHLTCSTTMEGLWQINQVLQTGALPALQDLNLEATVAGDYDEKEVELLKEALMRRIQKVAVNVNHVAES